MRSICVHLILTCFVLGFAVRAASADPLTEMIVSGRFDEAAKVAQELVDQSVKLNGDTHWKTAEARERLQVMKSVAEHSPEEKKRFQQIWRWLADPKRVPNDAGPDDRVEFLETAFPKAVLLRATVLERDSFDEFGKGRYAAAKASAGNAREIYSASSTPHPGQGRTTETCGLCDMMLSRKADAANQLRAAVEAFEQALGSHHPRTMLSRSHLAYLLSSMGKHDESLELLQLVRPFNQAHFGPNHLNTLKANLFSGVDLIHSGDVVRGIAVIQQTTQMAKSALGEHHLFVASCLSHLANGLRIQAQYDDAADAFADALAIYSKKLGPNHMQTAKLHWNLAFVQFLQEEFADAKKSAERVVQIQKQLRAQRSLSLMIDATELIFECDRHLGIRPKARDYETLLRNGLRFEEEHNGVESREAAIAMLRLGRFLASINRDDEAISVLSKASSILAGADGTDQLHLIACKQTLGNIYRQQGEVDKAIAEYSSAVELFEESRRRVGFTGLSSLATTELDRTAPTLAIMLAKNGQAVEAWRQLEQWRAFQLTDELEAELSDTASAAKEKSSKHALERVQSSLDVDEAIASWIGVWFDQQQRGEIWACVVRKSGDPQWIELAGSNKDGSFAMEEMRRDHDVLRAMLTDGKSSTRWDAEGVERLASERFHPIEKALHAKNGMPAVRRLIVTLPGAGDLPLEVLTVNYAISYTPSATFLAWQRSRLGPKANTSPMLFAIADPQFKAESPPTDLLATNRPGNNRIRKSYAPLPGTRVEVEAIASMFAPASVKTLFGEDANEAEIETLATQRELEQYRYLHFATHGDPNRDAPFQSSLRLASPPTESIDDLLSDDHLYDDRLTAAQVRNWQLNADLVTLSACDTALGPRVRGKAFVGFSQAFLLAGAKSVVASNWQVRDDATSLLMRRFYQNLLGQREELNDPMPKAEALNEAKRWLRNLTINDIDRMLDDLPPVVRGTIEKRLPDVKIESAKPFENPYFWAPFVLIGDSR
ncbi:MAG: CHAT domain-containing protein [Planctomycetales bacterium]|nr:CHAT domain-containing protein [Planctomycetales bacterium]